MEFLVDTLRKVKGEVCGVCNSSVLSSDPNVYSKTEKQPNESKEDRQARLKLKDEKPLRVHCGHFYHAKCLDNFMTDPPFGAACKVRQNCQDS